MPNQLDFDLELLAPAWFDPDLYSANWFNESLVSYSPGAGSGPVDFEYLCPFEGDQTNLGLTGFPQGTSMNVWLNKVWGETPGGIFCEIKSTWATPSYLCTFDSPLGSYTTTTTAGLITAAYFRILVFNYELSVDGDCAYTVSWDSIEVYLSLSGDEADENLVLTQGSYAYTSPAGHYDKRLDCTIVKPVNTPVDAPSSIDCDSVEIEANVHCVFNRGGYRWRYQSDLIWHTDEIILDDGTAAEDCDTCSLALPSLWDGITMDSYNVIVPSSIDWTIVDGTQTPYLCLCAVGQKSGYTFHKIGDWQEKAAGPVYIKKKTDLVGRERIITGWRCDDNGSLTEDDDDTYSTPAVTTCASDRSAIRLLFDVFCIESELRPCAGYEAGGGDCPGVPGDEPDTYCYYSGARQISWPDLPLCSSVGDLSSDVDLQAGIRFVTVVDSARVLTILKAGNDKVNRTIVPDIDCDWATIRIDLTHPEQHVLLLVGDGADLDFWRSTDRGETYDYMSTEYSGTDPKPFILCGRDGHRYIYFEDAGNLKGIIKDRNDDTIVSVFTIDTGVDSVKPTADDDAVNKGERQIRLTYAKGGDIIHLYSEDGETFV